MTARGVPRQRAGMKAFGFSRDDSTQKAVMVKVYSEEIAAFYDPKTKTMHLIKEPQRPRRRSPASSSALRQEEGFDKDENKTVIAHELTHALADQNYDLDAMQKAVKDDDDRSMALSALIEGEATLAMIGAEHGRLGRLAGSARLPPAELDRISA